MTESMFNSLLALIGFSIVIQLAQLFVTVFYLSRKENR